MCANDSRVTLDLKEKENKKNTLNDRSLSRIDDRRKNEKTRYYHSPTFVLLTISLTHTHAHTHSLSLSLSLLQRIGFVSLSHTLTHTHARSLSCVYNRLKNTHSLKKIKRYTQSTGTADGCKNYSNQRQRSA